MILAFLDNFKGDRVCSKMLWKEALHRDYEPKRIELKQICDIMNNSVTDWITMNVYTHIGFDDAEEELKRMEEFRKAQAEIEKKNEKPMSQKMFKVI